MQDNVDQSLMDDTTFWAYCCVRFSQAFIRFAACKNSRWERILNKLMADYQQVDPDNMNDDEELELLAILCGGQGIDFHRYVRLFTQFATDIKAGKIPGFYPER